MDVVIIGAGGHGKVVLDILRAVGEHTIVGFLDADPALAGSRLRGVEVLGSINLLPRLRQRKALGAIVAIGDGRVRVSYAQAVLADGLELISAIHPAAVVSPSARIGRNVVIAAGAVVAPDAIIADSVIVNTHAGVDHECEVDEGAHLCPSVALAGKVHVGAGAFLGIGARVLPCLSIGERAIVGAGAVVIRDVPPGVTVVGVPAKILPVHRS